MSRRSSGAARSASSSVVSRRSVRNANCPATALGSVRCSPWESAQAGTSRWSRTRRYPAASSSRKSARYAWASCGRSEARSVRLRTSVSRSRNSASRSGSSRASAPARPASASSYSPAWRPASVSVDHVSSARSSRENWSGASGESSRPTESSASRPKSSARRGERSKYDQLRSIVVCRPSTSRAALRKVWKYSPIVSASEERTPWRPVDRLQQRQVAVGNDHLLRSGGEVGAQGLGVEGHR